jgi:hypothetical protein
MAFFADCVQLSPIDFGMGKSYDYLKFAVSLTVWAAIIMFRKLISLISAAALFLGSVIPAGADMTGVPGAVYFRYRDISLVNSVPTPVSKDVTVFYVGGLGLAFSELLPLKPEWENDSWRVVSGTLPQGLTFNSATRTFEGTPTVETSGLSVDLEGRDATGNPVASARATFDIFTIKGDVIKTDIYAHTGKYKLRELQVPNGITVRSWERFAQYATPPGVTVNGPYFEGTPTSAGRWRYLIVGRDYNGETVVSFYGSYIVDNGPEFPNIADDVQNLPDPRKLDGLNYSFGPTPITHPLGDPSKVRYYLEVADGSALPGSVVSNNSPFQLHLDGGVTQPYDTGTIRWKAIDVDDTIGYSNWFKFGSADPTPICDDGEGQSVVFTTGKTYNLKLAPAIGDKGTLSYAITSGTLPNGLSFDGTTGRVNGSPLAAETYRFVSIQVTVSNDGQDVSTVCKYNVSSVNGDFSLADSTPLQQRHIRVGDTYKGSLAIKGGIKDFDTTLKDPSSWPDFAISTAPSKNVNVIELIGSPRVAGTYSVPLIATNGDGNRVTRNATIYAHGALAIGQVDTVHVKRLAAASKWATVPYDASTVIPDVANGNQPRFALSPASSLPAGLSIAQDGTINGATSVVAGSFGPFTASISDYSGQSASSNPFMVVVDPRDQIAINSVVEPTFTATIGTQQLATPVTVSQPPGAASFDITWKINDLDGIGIPSWMHFDTTTGTITADQNIPFEDIKSYGKFSITVTDSEGSTTTSDPFDVNVIDIPSPRAFVTALWNGTVSGDPTVGETETTLDIANLKSFIDDTTVIGGKDAVTFVSADPESPAALTFDAANGVFYGVPKYEFKGNVNVTFKDTKGRQGVMALPVEVRPYPTVSTDPSYDLPRLSTPAIVPRGSAGFWNAPSWSVDTSKGTDISSYGLSVNNLTGAIQGRATASVGTVIQNVVLKAISAGAKGERLVSWTKPFSINVTAATDLSLDYTPRTSAYYLLRNKNGGFDFVSSSLATPVVKGSYVAPLTFSLDRQSAISNGMPDRIGINSANGQITGTPDTLGKWEVYANVVDKEGNGPGDPVPLTIFATLSGYVARADGDVSFTLRQGEPFSTTPVSISNEVRPVVFATSPANIPASVANGFDAMTGSFSDQSAFDDYTGSYVIDVGVKDADGRGFESPPRLNFSVIAPLSMSIATASATGKQFAADGAINIDFAPVLKNVMGNITYDIDGDLPGTLVKKVYDQQGNFVNFAWTDGSGPVTANPDQQALLPPDALVFDTLTPSLKGIPSKAGTFSATLVAYDDHSKAYIRDVGTKVTYNKAVSRPITFVVSPADPFVVANNIDSETLYQYTSHPTVVSTASNPAYGRKVAWQQITSNLPDGVIATQSDNTVAYTGYPNVQGDFGGNVWRAVDAAGRKSDSPAVNFTVSPRKAFTLAADSPSIVTVNDNTAQVPVTAMNPARDVSIPADKWTVSGSLPPGMTYSVANGTLVFVGPATTVGDYPAVTVTATDSIGAKASASVAFQVINPQGPIELNVTNVTTKIGIPFSMQGTASNTYGKVQFYSYDIDGDPKTHVPGQYASDLDIGLSSGLVSGAFQTEGDRSVNVYVTDITNRVTSKPLTVSVLPKLRLTVPTVVAATQGDTLTRTIDTAYSLGTVAYVKGSGNWPAGIVVDPVTGLISAVDSSSGSTVNRVVVAPGTYSGLTIKAIDTFQVSGVTYTDPSESNSFSLQVAPTTAIPDIQDPAKTILGTQNAQIANWTPTVNELGTSKKWAYGGTVYKANYDLSQYGLIFDTTTGTISGTPTSPFIIRDFTVTVTSPRGDVDTTKSFWIGVAPQQALAIAANQKTIYSVRIPTDFRSDSLAVLNYIGNLTFAKATTTSLSFDTTTGAYYIPATSQSASIAGKNDYVAKVTDEFNRTVNFTASVQFAVALDISLASQSVATDKAITLPVPTIKGAIGALTYTAQNLPTGLQINATTGVISGTITSSSFVTNPISVTLGVVDAADGATASGTFSLAINLTAARHWRFVGDTVTVHSTGDFMCLTELRWATAAGDVSLQGSLSVDSPYPSLTSPISVLVDGVTAAGYGPGLFCTGGLNGTDAFGKKHWIQIDFSSPQPINKLTISARNDGSTASYPRAWTVQNSVDGITWYTSWTGAYPIASGVTYATIKP